MNANEIRPNLAEDYSYIVTFLESLETEERVRALPHLNERAPNVEIGDLIATIGEDKSSTATDDQNIDNNKNGNPSIVSLRRKGLKSFSISLLSLNTPTTSPYQHITHLDVSNNELMDLPGLSDLSNLLELSIERNWFNTIPLGIGHLSKLRKINASRNFLKPNAASLRLDQLKLLPELMEINLSYNKKCCTTLHRDNIEKELTPQKVNVIITVWEEMSLQKQLITANGSSDTGQDSFMYVGSSAAVRNPDLLRSQLEPWGTVALRRRLVQDFGHEPTDPSLVNRAKVMNQLLRCYHNEGMLVLNTEQNGEDDLNSGVGRRKVFKVEGLAVRKELLDEILVELKNWQGDGKRGGSSNNRERPSIQATSYMILRDPELDISNQSRRSQRMAKKIERNRHLWNIAIQALVEVDKEFRCSEIAVTYGFTGSPHIDKQNSSPFYGLSLGDFSEGTGCIAVECSARVLAEVNTKNKLGKVDGRYPHWVTNYDRNSERFSLIYYDTVSSYKSPGPSVFTTPS
jgi:hypothetical protein